MKSRKLKKKFAAELEYYLFSYAGNVLFLSPVDPDDS